MNINGRSSIRRRYGISLPSFRSLKPRCGSKRTNSLSLYAAASSSYSYWKCFYRSGWNCWSRPHSCTTLRSSLYTCSGSYGRSCACLRGLPC